MQQLWLEHLGSSARAGKAMYPSPDAHSRCLANVGYAES